MATCVDGQDGAVEVQSPVELAISLDTSRPTLPDAPIVLTYYCADLAGNRASIQRRIHILSDQCADASATTGQREHVCPIMYESDEEGGVECSMYGVCAVQQVYVDPEPEKAQLMALSTPVDAIPPNIHLVSMWPNAIMDQTVDGMLVLREEVTQGERYVDPGYVCVDQMDGDLSEHVGAFGNLAIDTRLATTEPQIIRYTCTDRAGAKSREVQRWITVVPKCGKGVETCPDGSCPVDDADTCITTGVAVETEEQMHPEILHPDSPPLISLIGNAMLVVEDQGYRACTPELEVSAICDHGATAHDDVDGDLTPYVQACGLNFEKHGISGCTIYGESYPGTYEVTFSVVDSAGHEASVARLVTLLAKCDAGEVLCADGLTCVPEGVPCEVDIAPAVEVAAEPPTPPSPPNVTAIGNRVVSLPRFTPCISCQTEQVPTKELPCDLGAKAIDEEDGDLQAGLLVCPPDTCLISGCVGHELWRKGVDSCVNASAPIGTTFDVSFVAFDTTGVYASDVRSVTITAPCAEGQHWCPANSPSGRCEEATCETIDAITGEGGLLPSVLIKDVENNPSGPKIEWRTPSLEEMPFAFVFGQTPWQSLNDMTGGNPLVACHKTLNLAFFPQCVAKANDAIDGDVTETLHAYNRQGECTPSVLAAGLCRPGVHVFYLTAYDRDGNQGYGDVALTIDIVQGYEETYTVNRTGPCEPFLDPRIEDSAEVRSNVAAELNVHRGRVRVHACEKLGGDIARLEVVVVRSFYDDNPAKHRRKLEQQDGSSSMLSLLRIGPDSADPRGPWYANQHTRILSLAAQDLAVRTDNTTIGTNLTMQLSSDLAKSEIVSAVSARIDDAYASNVEEILTQQVNLASRADELADLVAKTIALTAQEEDAFEDIGNNTLAAQARLDELTASLNVVTSTIDGVNTATPDVVAGCRGARGSRHSYFDVTAAGGGENDTSSTAVPIARRRIIAPSSSSRKTTMGSEDLVGSRWQIGVVSRKLLRVSASGKDKRIVTKLSEGDSNDAWSGYASDVNVEDDLRLVDHVGYKRPRTLGATGQLRIVGGVLVTQRRASREAGCRGRTSRGAGQGTSNGVDVIKSRQGRFEDLYREMRCSSLDAGAAYGFDAMFARLDLPKDVTNPVDTNLHGLYDPTLRSVRAAFYNDSELAAPDTPFAFFDRDYDPNREMSSTDMERALFDVYLDGTLMESRAKRLLSYLYLSRFVDRRTRSVDIRVILHNEPADVLVDVRVRMVVSAQGELSSITEIGKVPLFDYFDGSTGHLGLFVVEVIVAALAVLLCISSVGDARRFAHLLHESIIRRLQQRIVHRHFMVDAWMVVVDAIQLAIPLCLLAASIVHFVYFFAYVRDFTYERSYRWYDGDGSAEARILLPKRLADPQPPVEGYPRGAWRHTLPVDLSERDAYLSLLDKVDAMSTLNGWYLVLQVPILLGIAANIIRHFFGLPMMYPYMRTLQRGLPNMITLIGVMMFFTILCAYALYILVGHRMSMHARAHHAIESLAESQVGDSSGLQYRVNLGMGEGVIVEPTENVALALVHVFYPLITVFVLMQFVVAILLDFFTEERQRRLARERLDRKKESQVDSIARSSMRTSGHLDEVRDILSSVLYNLGWRNTAAFVFSGNAKWLDPRRGLRGFEASSGIRGFEMDSNEASSSSSHSNALLENPRAKVNALILSTWWSKGPAIELKSKLSAKDRWRSARRLLHSSWQAASMLDVMMKRIQHDREGRERGLDSEENGSRVELFTSDAREDGLRMDTDRYLRMNRVNRQELVLPKLGLLGTNWCWVCFFLCVICMCLALG